MPLLNTLDKIYRGSTAIDKAYYAGQQVWPPPAPPSGFTPDQLTGLAVWFDAAHYTPGSWPNQAAGGAVSVVQGTPNPAVSTNQLNGLPLVRFSGNEGRVRITSGSGVNQEWTIAYVARMLGPITGRIVNGIYPPNNLLVGWWNGNQDVMYDAGFANNGYTGWTNAWKTYSADGTAAAPGGGQASRLFSDGVLLGTLTSGQGFGGTLAVSGYANPSAEESCDCEVAEVVQYNRRLTDAERQQVEGYLHDKWFVEHPRYDADTQAYLDATGLDVSYAPALDALVSSLKANGLWSKMTAIYPMIGGTANLHQWNLKDPRDADAAYRLTFHDGPSTTNSTALGYRPSAQGQMVDVGGYADTHLTPSTELADVNSTHLAYYSLAEVPPGDRCELGCYNWSGGGSRFHIIACYNGNAFYFGMGEEGATYTLTPSSTGLFVTTRTAADRTAAFRNGTLLTTSSAPPTNGLPNFPVWVGGIDAYRGRSDLPCGFASIGSGLDDRNVSDLYNIVQSYQTALNRQV